MFIDHLLKNGHTRIVHGDRRDCSVGAIWYLPHHPVLNTNKPGKVHVVFDCAAKLQGTSLNDQLLEGPDLTNNLVGILMCFRQEPVALLAEVELTFHQVCVSSNDCDALRFLWQPSNDLNCEPEEYQMMVHLFGAMSPSSCVNFSQLPKILQGSSRHRQRTLPHQRLPQVSPIRNRGHWSGERAPHTSLEWSVPLDKMDLQFPEGHRFYSTIGKSGIREVPSPQLSGPWDSDGMWGLIPLASR